MAPTETEDCLAIYLNLDTSMGPGRSCETYILDSWNAARPGHRCQNNGHSPNQIYNEGSTFDQPGSTGSTRFAKILFTTCQNYEFPFLEASPTLLKLAIHHNGYYS